MPAVISREKVAGVSNRRPTTTLISTSKPTNSQARAKRTVPTASVDRAVVVGKSTRTSKVVKTEENILPSSESAAENYIENLTGGQIQEILDFLIIESAAPIIRITEAFDLQVTHLLVTAARNKKRKLSALPREDFIDILCQVLSTRVAERKIELLMTAKIERGFIYKFVRNFMEHTEFYEVVYQKYMVSSGVERQRYEGKLRAIESLVGAPRLKLFNARQSIQDYMELMYKFRNSIVEQYLKFAFKQAKIFVAQKGDNFDFSDVYQNFLTAVTKAVDKYDCSKGALTSYIQYWILNAQSSTSDHGHEYGVAYTIPQLQKKALAITGSNGKGVATNQVNFGVSLDQLTNEEDGTKLSDYIESPGSIEDTLERKQELNEVRYLVKAADIRGLARLYLEIDEVFTAKELRRMKMSMRRQSKI